MYVCAGRPAFALLGSTEIWTRIAEFRVQSANGKVIILEEQ